MSRLFHAGAGLALGLNLILFGAVAGCGGEDDMDADAGLGTVGAPAAEPGQATIPESEPGAAGTTGEGTGGTADVPVTEDPSAPGTGP
jgi:hypothetical protein